jgi:LPS-assembly protein
VFGAFSAASAYAQDGPALNAATPVTTAAPLGESSAQDLVRFEADKVRYDSESEVVTANGGVVLRHVDQTVRADNVVWDRKTGQIMATGNIRFVDVDGNIVYTDKVELTDTLRRARSKTC